jgi:Flp pilus assembly protein TadD
VQGLQPPKRRWRLYAAGAAVLLAGAWFLRLQSSPGERNAPRLGTVAAAHAERAAPAVAVVHATEKELVAAKPAPQQLAAPTEPATSSSDRLYANALEQGEAQLRLGRYRSAIVHFQRAVKEKPQEVPALLALGDAFLEADRPGSAVSPLESAARLDGQSGRAQLLLGTAYQSLGRNADAVTAYQRYLDLEPRGEFARDVQLILAKLSR